MAFGSLVFFISATAGAMGVTLPERGRADGPREPSEIDSALIGVAGAWAGCDFSSAWPFAASRVALKPSAFSFVAVASAIEVASPERRRADDPVGLVAILGPAGDLVALQPRQYWGTAESELAPWASWMPAGFASSGSTGARPVIHFVKVILQGRT